MPYPTNYNIPVRALSPNTQTRARADITTYSFERGVDRPAVVIEFSGDNDLRSRDSESYRSIEELTRASALEAERDWELLFDLGGNSSDDSAIGRSEFPQDEVLNPVDSFEPRITRFSSPTHLSEELNSIGWHVWPEVLSVGGERGDQIMENRFESPTQFSEDPTARNDVSRSDQYDSEPTDPEVEC